MIDEEISLHFEEVHIINFEKVVSLLWTFRNFLNSTRWNYFFDFKYSIFAILCIAICNLNRIMYRLLMSW